MNRVLLVNTTKAPTREELVSTDRAIGDALFASFGIDFGGYIVVPGDMKLAAQWLVPNDKVRVVQQYVENVKIPGYEAQIHVRSKSLNGDFITVDSVRLS